MFVPQTYHWGQEGQVDWYEAWAEVDGEVCLFADPMNVSEWFRADEEGNLVGREEGVILKPI
mgnify:CR=1 FL=1